MTKPSTGLILRTAMGDGIRELLRLPFWWYTTGLKETLGKLLHSVRVSVRYFGVDVWSKNLFTPMYGDTSITGRAISFVVRMAVLIARSFGVALWALVAVLFAGVYLVVLPVSFIGFITSLFGVFF